MVSQLEGSRRLKAGEGASESEEDSNWGASSLAVVDHAGCRKVQENKSRLTPQKKCRMNNTRTLVSLSSLAYKLANSCLTPSLSNTGYFDTRFKAAAVGGTWETLMLPMGSALGSAEWVCCAGEEEDDDADELVEEVAGAACETGSAWVVAAMVLLLAETMQLREETEAWTMAVGLCSSAREP